MSCASADMLLSSRDVFPMPSLALAPAAWYLGAHMLRCIQEVSLKTGCGQTVKHLPSRMKMDKSTQTVASFARERAQGRKTPTKCGIRRTDKTSGQDKVARGGRKTVCEAKPGIRSSKSDPMKRRTSLDKKTSKMERSKTENLKRENLKTEALKKENLKRENLKKENLKIESSKTELKNQKSGVQSSNLKSRPTKGSMMKDKRRLSAGDCPKRTSESSADEVRAKWLPNPVYASDGESDGRRTDRSEMSPPWLDISVAKEVKTIKLDQKTVTGPSVLDMAKAAARHVPAKIRSTQPKMEVVPETTRTVNLRKDAPPTPVAPRVAPFSATDIAIRQTIERKLGKPLSEVDTASLKSISEKRMKELTEKYARNRPDIKLADRDIPASIVARLRSHARDSADSICQQVDPQRGRVVV